MSLSARHDFANKISQTRIMSLPMIGLALVCCLFVVFGEDEVDVEYANAINFIRTKYSVTREISTLECPWLQEPILAGTVVFEYIGETHGAITKSGVAVTLSADLGAPFIELPRNSLQPVESSDGEFMGGERPPAFGREIDGVEEDAFVSRKRRIDIPNFDDDDVVSRKGNERSPSFEVEEELPPTPRTPKFRRSGRLSSVDCPVEPFALLRFEDFVAKRDVTKKECHWLSSDIKAGQKLRAFHGATYGAISPCGIAVFDPHTQDESFVEVPADALEGLDIKPEL